ncbi:hypothetical protein MSTE_03131 [Mycobacteroides stephanolepidis]|uniref:Uncharacterized protein n=1 Tax=[Mycobacterium] stephanolepidis TaxID=1520670 RepID=A0A1Z4EZP4_9MYCO|nr:hypothetical protein MSTE_03131 [[Mycobacterium] stephanolepidis]
MITVFIIAKYGRHPADWHADVEWEDERLSRRLRNEPGRRPGVRRRMRV